MTTPSTAAVLATVKTILADPQLGTHGAEVARMYLDWETLRGWTVQEIADFLGVCKSKAEKALRAGAEYLPRDGAPKRLQPVKGGGR